MSRADRAAAVGVDEEHAAGALEDSSPAVGGIAEPREIRAQRRGLGLEEDLVGAVAVEQFDTDGVGDRLADVAGGVLD
jgi:hypothetical protein